MKIDEKYIEEVFDELEKKFDELAKYEDLCAEKIDIIESFKDGSTGKAQALLDYQNILKEKNKVAREYNKLLMKVDRLKTLLRLGGE